MVYVSWKTAVEGWNLGLPSSILLVKFAEKLQLQNISPSQDGRRATGILRWVTYYIHSIYIYICCELCCAQLDSIFECRARAHCRRIGARNRIPLGTGNSIPIIGILGEAWSLGRIWWNICHLVVSTSRSKAMAFQRQQIAEVTTPMPAQPMEDVKVSMESTRTKMAYAPAFWLRVFFCDFSGFHGAKTEAATSRAIKRHLVASFFLVLFFPLQARFETSQTNRWDESIDAKGITTYFITKYHL